MSSFRSKIRFTVQLLRPAIVIVLGFLLAFAPYRVIAQATAAAPANSSSATAPSSGSASTDSSKSGDDQEKAFLHSSVIQSIARALHLDVDTTSYIFLAINFAVIFLAIVIPLGRVMPKIFRKRSQTLTHSLETARAATADANARLSAVEAKLAGLDEEIKKFRAQVEHDSLEDEKRIKDTIGEESARILAAAEQEIGVAAAQARRGLRNFAAELAIEHAEKQLTLTPETDRALIAEFVAGVAGDGAGKGGKS